jgi:hypothetical protein
VSAKVLGIFVQLLLEFQGSTLLITPASETETKCDTLLGGEIHVGYAFSPTQPLKRIQVVTITYVPPNDLFYNDWLNIP